MSVYLLKAEVHTNYLLTLGATIDPMVSEPPFLDYDQSFNPSITVRTDWLDVLLIRLHTNSSYRSNGLRISDGWSRELARGAYCTLQPLDGRRAAERLHSSNTTYLDISQSFNPSTNHLREASAPT